MQRPIDGQKNFHGKKISRFRKMAKLNSAKSQVFFANTAKLNVAKIKEFSNRELNSAKS